MQLHYFKTLCIFNIILGSLCISAQPTWTVHPNQSPLRSGGLMLLMSNGEVLCKSSDGNGDGFGNLWFKLTPSATGSYKNGAWSIAAPMTDSRLYFSSQLLKNGKLYVAGGEYGSGIGTAEMYDPVSNVWTNLPAGTGHIFSDGNSAILDDGRILQSDLASTGKRNYIFNPQNNTYIAGPNCLGRHNEATWIKLPDNSILFVDMNSTNTERYIPALNQWIADANAPVSLYDPFVYETGPAMLLPNGKVIFFGATGNTAIYTPSGNNTNGSWITGPALPPGIGCPDTQAAMKIDGKIIFTASKSVTSTASAFDPPTYFYEFNYLNNTFSPIQAPGGGFTVNDSAFNFNMLNLPDCTTMLSQVNSKSFYFHQASGTALAAGIPTINNIQQNNCANSFTATGLNFNGICEGASFGDDWQMNTNFPIIRLSAGTNVYYARTFNWNHTGVFTGSLPDTTQFTLPANIPNGTYSLQVVVNGIASAPYTFTFNAFPTLTSGTSASVICSGTSFSYHATSGLSGTNIQWTKAAVTGISNPAITVPQTSDPSETFTNTSNTAKTVVYAYTLTNGACSANYLVNCVVFPKPPLAISGNTLVCPTFSSVLTATGAGSYTWNTGSNNNTIAITPSVNSIFGVVGEDNFGCQSAAQLTVMVKPYPQFTIVGNPRICKFDSTLLMVVGNPTGFLWSTGAITSSIMVRPLLNTTYTVSCNIPGGCLKSDTIQVKVDLCAGISQNDISRDFEIFPNPFKESFSIKIGTPISGEFSLSIRDLSGRIVMQKPLRLDTDTNKIEEGLSGLNKGLYFIDIVGQSLQFHGRLVKE